MPQVRVDARMQRAEQLRPKLLSSRQCLVAKALRCRAAYSTSVPQPQSHHS